PYCPDYTTTVQQGACTLVERCVRQTGCDLKGVTYCFCGISDLTTCTGSLSGPQGPCKTEIMAGFPTNTTPAQMLGGLTTVSSPAGGAMPFIQCDLDQCSGVCIPYCK